MISVDEALAIHDRMLEGFGGGNGVRDMGALEAALARPFATFGGEDLLKNPVEKAAAIIESILINHPFIDGNKRTGYVLMRLLLMEYGVDILATESEKYEFVVGIASGKFKADYIQNWISSKLVKFK